MKIIAWMTVKNEEWYVAMAIRSVLPYVEKLLILDTGSTDSTLYEIMKIENDKIDLEQVDGFSKGVDQNGFYNRPYWCNHLIQKCLSLNPGYLLNIDADEYFTPKTFKILKDNPDRRCYTFSTFDLTSLQGHFLDGSDDYGRDTLNYPHTRIVKADSNYCFIPDSDKPQYGYRHAQGSLNGKDFIEWDFVSEEICHLHLRWLGPKRLRDDFPENTEQFNPNLLSDLDESTRNHLKTFDINLAKKPPPIEKNTIRSRSIPVINNYYHWRDTTMLPANNKNLYIYFQYEGGGLGDTIMQIPAFRYLKKMNPEHNLIVLVDDRYLTTYNYCKYIDYALPVKYVYVQLPDGSRGGLHIKKNPDDIFLEATGNLLTHLQGHILHAEFERITKVPYTDDIPLDYEISVPYSELKDIEKSKKEILRLANGRKIVAIGPAFTFIHKMWQTSYWERLVDLLHEKDYFVMSLGATKDLYVGNIDLDAKGIYPIHHIPSILEVAEAIFVLNSGMLHVAGINQDIKIVLISPGPFPPQKYLLYRHGKMGHNMIYIGHDCEEKDNCLKYGFNPNPNINLRVLGAEELIKQWEQEQKSKFPVNDVHHAKKFVTWHYCYKNENQFECTKKVTPEKVMKAFVDFKIIPS